MAMKKSSARWKIVVGHHTMRSVSEHGDTEELLQLLLPVLKVTFQKLYISYQLVKTFRKLHNNPEYFCEFFFTQFRKMASTSTSTDMITAWNTLAAETGIDTIPYDTELNSINFQNMNSSVSILLNKPRFCCFSPLQYFTSGGGSKAWRGIIRPNKDKLRFFYDGQGFMSLQLNQDQAHFIFYDVSGKILYQWSSSKTRHPKPSTYLDDDE